MSGTVRARMKRGMLELLEKVDIPEGTEVSVTILQAPGPKAQMVCAGLLVVGRDLLMRKS